MKTKETIAFLIVSYYCYGAHNKKIWLIFLISVHLLKSHQLHQSQTLNSPVQTILQPKPTPIVVLKEHQQTKAMEGMQQQQHQQPPVTMLQNFVTPNTPPLQRCKKDSMTVKFEVPGGNKLEKVNIIMPRKYF